ncbi:esterase/lipase family protein [Dietzia alimentaria]|uniref:esterase/lipase family protein n=1 Tax=Dietzia alimentaria TaxID=665550 RepID=UPI00029AC66C|nr:alpha/beta fold hydrolase [Dietzia alimentaria]
MGFLRTARHLLAAGAAGYALATLLPALRDARLAKAIDPGSREPLPVPYTFLSGALREIITPGSTLLGANNWECRPSPEKPRPVILLHGTAGSGATNWATYGPLLNNEGFCVFSLTYGARPGATWPVSELGGLADIEKVSMPEVGRFIDRVLEATGAEQVDLVGHSQGSMVAGLVAKFERPGLVHTVVSISPLWKGSGGDFSLRALGALPGGRGQAERLIPPYLEQVSPGSRLLQKLWTGFTPYAPGVRYTNIASRYDGAIWPFDSGLVPGEDVTNILVQDGCSKDYSDHVAMASSPRVADFVLSALDPDTPRVPRCVAIAPIHGPFGM